MNQAVSTRRRSRGTDAPAQPFNVPPPPRPPYGYAVGAGAVVFALYALTLAPTTAFWDTSEYIATTHILGIPHPPGNPLFVLLARTWELLLAPTGLATAVKVNLFSALMSAGAAGFWFLVVHRILGEFTERNVVRLGGAVAAVLLSATAFTVWHQSNVNEKVYTVSLFTIALLSWLAFRWRDNTERHGAEIRTGRRPTGAMGDNTRWHDDNVLVLMIFVLALSVGNHLMAFLAAPALLVLILMVRPRVLLNWQLYAWGLGFAVLGLSVHLYLPIRAGLEPIINEAAPTCASLRDAFVSVVTFGQAGCADLSAALAREQYAKPSVFERQAPLWAQVANYFQYFDWQWARSLQGSNGYLAVARLPVTLLTLALGGYGAWEHWKRDRVSFAYIGVLFVTLSLGLILYLNFRYGYAQVSVLGLPGDAGEVRERDYFYLISFSVWGLWAGIGLAALWLRGIDSFRDRPKAVLLGASVMLVALLPLLLNWSYASRAGDHSARDWAYNLLQSVEPYAVLFTNGDNDTFPLWYLQEVEGIRQDVQVMVASYLNTPWYARQVRDLTAPCEEGVSAADDRTRIICQRAFQPDRAPDVYSENGVPEPPSRSALPLSDAQITTATGRGGWVPVPEGALFEERGIQARINPGEILSPADQFMLTIVREAWGDRPVYFAATTQNHQRLGLAPYVARQGAAYKLLAPEELGEMVAISQDSPWAVVSGTHVDADRHRTLLNDVFIHRDLADRSHWVDDATRGIPSYYAHAHAALALVEQGAGDAQAAEANWNAVEQWLGLAER